MATQLREDITAERGNHNNFRSAGMARRIIPVIEILRNKGSITILEWAALQRYRDIAHKAEEDEGNSSPLAPDRIMGGSRGTMTSGPLPRNKWSPAISDNARLETDLGELREIARLIAVEDYTLRAYCIYKHGSRQRSSGAIVPKGADNGERNIKLALQDLRQAAHRIVP